MVARRPARRLLLHCREWKDRCATSGDRSRGGKAKLDPTAPVGVSVQGGDKNRRV